MGAVVALLAALATPYLLLTWYEQRPGATVRPWRWRLRISLGLMFWVTGAMHFWIGHVMMQMLPAWVPDRLVIIWATGIFELLGGTGLWLERWKRAAGWGLIMLLIGVFPANVYAAWQHVDLGGHGAGPWYLLIRVPLQIFLVGLVYRAACDAQT